MKSERPNSAVPAVTASGFRPTTIRRFSTVKMAQLNALPATRTFPSSEPPSVAPPTMTPTPAIESTIPIAPNREMDSPRTAAASSVISIGVAAWIRVVLAALVRWTP
jgi:hypothetical protein